MKFSSLMTALQTTSTGSAGYRRSRVGLAGARQLGDKVSLGIRINYHQLQVAGYGNATAISADAGLLLRLSEKLHFSVQLLNPAAADAMDALYIPAIYSAGIGYEQSEQVYISLEWKKEQEQLLNGVLSFQYKMHSPLFFRVAVQTSVPSFIFGTGFTRNRLRIDIYSSYHLRLGMGSGLQLLWFWKNENDTN